MSILERYRKSKEEKHDRNRQAVIEASRNIYQIKEYNGELWFTYDNRLVCPCAMLVEPPVTAVEKMRELYVERTPKLTRI